MSDAAVPPTGGRRILVADDDQDSAESLAMLFQMMGHDVRSALNGLEAVDVAANFRPDLIVLDIGMPGLDGYEVCRRIRQQPWAQAVVIAALTGWTRDEDKDRSQEAGFDHYIVKPIDPKVLADLVARSGPSQDS
jgi:CheY-like chemotaxis protein